MRRIVLLLTLVVLCMAQSEEVLLGRSVDELVLVNSAGEPVSIRKLTADRPALLVIVPTSGGPNPCQAAVRFGRVELFQSPLRAVVVVGKFPPKNDCSGLKEVAFYESPSLKLDRSGRNVPLSAAVIDEAQHVRWALGIQNDEAGWKTLAAGVNTWFQGRQSFEANCGHCHGLDGAQASSPGVKSLVGITKKYPETKVLDLGAQFGGVDMTGWNRAKRETLLTYIRGL